MQQSGSNNNSSAAEMYPQSLLSAFCSAVACCGPSIAGHLSTMSDERTETGVLGLLHLVLQGIAHEGIVLPASLAARSLLRGALLTPPSAHLPLLGPCLGHLVQSIHQIQDQLPPSSATNPTIDHPKVSVVARANLIAALISAADALSTSNSQMM